MWKQDIGQWVERKGRHRWVKQQQQQFTPAPPRSAATRVGFIPEGFEDKHDDNDGAAMAEVAALPRKLRTSGEDPAFDGLHWVSIYGVSSNSILDVREYLDIMFGRTVDHTYPARTGAGQNNGHTLTMGKNQNWFYVKFEDPVAAARAVYQSPLTIPITAGHIGGAAAAAAASGAVAGGAAATTNKGQENGVVVREETVGVAWCTDETFIREDKQREQRHQAIRGGISDLGSPMREVKDFQNVLGATPCGTERLRRTPVSLSQKDSTVARPSRGLGSLLRDAFHSPWSTQWTTAPSRGDTSSPPSAAATTTTTTTTAAHGSPTSPASPAHTEVFRDGHQSPHTATTAAATREPITPRGSVEIPPCLLSRGRYHRHHHGGVRHLNNAVPVHPIPGNASVICVFRTDASRRGLLRRTVLALTYLPSRVFRVLFPSSPYDSDLGEVIDGENDKAAVAAAASDNQWLSIFDGFSIDRRYEQQRRMLRYRHYNAAARLRGLAGGYGTGATATAVAPIASWVPLRWYESSTVVSLLVLLLLLLLGFMLLSIFGGGHVSNADVWQTGRWDLSEEVSSPVVITGERLAEAATRVPADFVQATLFADGNYGSDRYIARTL